MQIRSCSVLGERAHRTSADLLSSRGGCGEIGQRHALRLKTESATVEKTNPIVIAFTKAQRRQLEFLEPQRRQHRTFGRNGLKRQGGRQADVFAIIRGRRCKRIQWNRPGTQPRKKWPACHVHQHPSEHGDKKGSYEGKDKIEGREPKRGSQWRGNVERKLRMNCLERQSTLRIEDGHPGPNAEPAFERKQHLTGLPSERLLRAGIEWARWQRLKFISGLDLASTVLNASTRVGMSTVVRPAADERCIGMTQRLMAWWNQLAQPELPPSPSG